LDKNKKYFLEHDTETWIDTPWLVCDGRLQLSPVIARFRYQSHAKKFMQCLNGLIRRKANLTLFAVLQNVRVFGTPKGPMIYIDEDKTFGPAKDNELTPLAMCSDPQVAITFNKVLPIVTSKEYRIGQGLKGYYPLTSQELDKYKQKHNINVDPKL
jgi:hypothetical protein